MSMDNNMDIATTSICSADQLVPVELREIGGDKVRAFYKVRPEDFTVEERTVSNHLCTVSDASDLLVSSPAFDGTAPGMVGVTARKYRRTHYDMQAAIASLFAIPKLYVTYAGMKDGNAFTASRLVIQGVSLDDVVKQCGKKFEHGNGWWSLKDAVPAARTLEHGMLVSNRFTIKVMVPGLNANQILEYVEGKLKNLRELAADLGKDLCHECGTEPQLLIPNAFGGQRDGRRRNLKDIGETIIRKGVRAGIRRFLCENCGIESQQARQIRADLDFTWGWLEDAEENNKEVDPKGYFCEMMTTLEQKHWQTGKPAYEVLSMTVEYDICKKLASGMSYEAVAERLFKKFSLWTGAYQSYWFNQVLARVLRKEIVLRGSGSIPLFVCTPESISFYQRYLPEALPLKPGCQPNGKITENDLEIDPTVKRLFLLPRKSGNGRLSSPWRKALVPVVGLKHHAEDGAWYAQFELRSGAYATVLLECLFDLQQDAGRFQRTVRNTSGRRS